MAETKRSTEELQREIVEVELETKRLALDAAKQANADYTARKALRAASNKQRMAELAQIRRNEAGRVATCRHKSGGTPQNIARGGGANSFSLITRYLMPDGVTYFLQCSRCPLKTYGRKLSEPDEAKLKKNDPAKYAEHVEFLRLLEESVDKGLEHCEMRGPTFIFQRADGTQVFPELV